MTAHTLTNARYITAAETSKIIRKQLKAAFPATKFSVRTTDRGTINIRWTDGPAAKRVDEIAHQFSGKGFDGMIDMEYHIDGWLLDGQIIGTRSRGTVGSRGVVEAWGMIAPHDDAELVSFGAGYIFTTRDISPTFARRLAAQVATYYRVEAPVVIDSGRGWWKLEQDRRVEFSNGYGEYFSTLIHQASVDATRFQLSTVEG